MTRRGTFQTPNLAGDLIFLNLLFAVGLTSIYPIYRDPWFFFAAAMSVIIANLITFLSVRRGWRWWKVGLTTAAAYLVVGLPLSSPHVLSAPESIGRSLIGVVTAPVTGWKDLVTLNLPLGTYQTTLTLVIALAIAVPVLSLTLAIRSATRWMLAAPVGLLLTVFGTVMGTSAPLGEVQVGGFILSAAFQLAIGLGAILIALTWVVWRMHASRSVSLGIAREASGARLHARSNRAQITRWSFGAVMLVIATTVGVVLTPAVVSGQTRDVLRTNVDPELHLKTALSPLVTYREFFTDEWFDTVLFEVDAPAGADRVRVATMRFYDGEHAKVVSSDHQSQETSFQRVPSPLMRGADDVFGATITVQELRGIWVPTLGSLASIEFEGDARVALSDGFFYNDDAAMGVELASPGLVTGTRYTQTGTLDTQPATEIGGFLPARSGGSLPEEVVPDRLEEWIEVQEVTKDGSGLIDSVQRLRERGYLSHALMLDEGASAEWARRLPDYTFESSRAGHSTDRINQLFGDLVDRENEVGRDAPDELLVATAGDDEQFALAAMMVADAFGFDSRVVLGAKLTSDESGGIPACANGVCTGGNMSVWVEVQDADTGNWAALDVTPQHRVAPSPDVEQRSDPKNVTEVDREHVDTVPPPEPNPTESAGNEDEGAEEGLDLTLLWSVLRIAAVILLALLVIVGPFALILLAKVIRKRTRKTAADPVDRVIGGWNEYVDRAIDHGAALPRTQTRQELALTYAGEAAEPLTLATLADHAAYSFDPVTDEMGAAYWQLVEAEGKRLSGGVTWPKKLKAALSLRSFAHGFARAKLEADAALGIKQASAKEPTLNFRMERPDQ